MALGLLAGWGGHSALDEAKYPAEFNQIGRIFHCLALDIGQHLTQAASDAVEMIAQVACSAAELMSSPVTTVQEDASLNEALGVMRGKKIRRLPVVNRAGGLFGMITSDDVINLIASELAMMAGLIVEQPIRESRLRK